MNIYKNGQLVSKEVSEVSEASKDIKVLREYNKKLEKFIDKKSIRQEFKQVNKEDELIFWACDGYRVAIENYNNINNITDKNNYNEFFNKIIVSNLYNQHTLYNKYFLIKLHEFYAAIKYIKNEITKAYAQIRKKPVERLLVSLTIDFGILRISSKALNIDIEIEIDTDLLEKHTIYFNVEYLFDTLDLLISNKENVVKYRKISLFFDTNKPLFIKDDKYFTVTLPVKV